MTDDRTQAEWQNRVQELVEVALQYKRERIEAKNRAAVLTAQLQEMRRESGAYWRGYEDGIARATERFLEEDLRALPRAVQEALANRVLAQLLSDDEGEGS